MNNYKLAIIISILMVFFAQSAVFAGNKAYLDQYQTNDIDEYNLINSEQILAQTFQPGINGKVTSISVKLSKISALLTDGTTIYPSDLIVEIRTTIDNIIPSEEVIATATINEIEIEEEIPQWYEFYFTTPPYLNKKNLYAIVLKTAQENDAFPDEPLASYFLYYAGNNDYDPYLNGQLMGKYPNASYMNWYISTAWSYIDCAFEIYMTKGDNN